MHKYRLYIYDAEDRLMAPVMGIFADNDATASRDHYVVRCHAAKGIGFPARITRRQEVMHYPLFFGAGWHPSLLIVFDLSFADLGQIEHGVLFSFAFHVVGEIECLGSAQY